MHIIKINILDKYTFINWTFPLESYGLNIPDREGLLIVGCQPVIEISATCHL